MRNITTAFFPFWEDKIFLKLLSQNFKVNQTSKKRKKNHPKQPSPQQQQKKTQTELFQLKQQTMQLQFLAKLSIKLHSYVLNNNKNL